MKDRIGIFALLAVAGLLSFPAIHAQSAAASLPGFEVATVKPGTPERGFGVQVRGGRLTTVNTSVSEIMAFAWSLHPRQITGGPAWMETEKYDLLAETGDQPKPDIRAMVQKLLADRFGLKYIAARKSSPCIRSSLARQAISSLTVPAIPMALPLTVSAPSAP